MSTESAIAREGDGEFGSTEDRVLGMLDLLAGITGRPHEMRYITCDWVNCMPV
jgi:hypothetical protein